MISAAEWLEQSGWRVHLRLARGTGAHVVIAGVESTQRRFGVDPGGTLFSAGASGSVRKAAEHAVRELVMFTEALPEVMRRGQIPDLPQMRRTDDVADVWRLYLRPEMRPLIEWFLSGEEVAPPSDLHDDRPESLIASLRAAGLSPLMVDMSVPRFAPFVAFQVYVPGLLPLTLGTDLARIGPAWRPADATALAWPTDAFQVRDGSYNPYPLPFS
jgi:ribosomal protein S12 methylthiotransferase accessory factor YcaO